MRRLLGMAPSSTQRARRHQVTGASRSAASPGRGAGAGSVCTCSERGGATATAASGLSVTLSPPLRCFLPRRPAPPPLPPAGGGAGGGAAAADCGPLLSTGGAPTGVSEVGVSTPALPWDASRAAEGKYHRQAA